MDYQIIPLEIGSIAERHIFQCGNKEIKCGMVWKLGSVLTHIKPTFTKSYDPNIGICIQDIPGGIMGETYAGEKVIYFSDNVEEGEEDELTEIFYESTRKYSKNYSDVFHDLGWIELSYQSYIYGEIEVIELNKNQNIHK
jgi:hypothetical protein